jgi:hypothetical protein
MAPANYLPEVLETCGARRAHALPRLAPAKVVKRNAVWLNSV